MVSILVVTLDRYDLAAKTVGPALQKAGCEYELLNWDNASSNRQVIDYMASLNPAVQIQSKENVGYAAALNQLLLRAKGDYFCVLDPDMGVPNHWLRKLVEVNQCIPNTGWGSYHCIDVLYPATIIGGCEVHPGPKIFGIKFFNRKVLETFGGFCEDYAPYGPEDADYLHRMEYHGGFVSYYLGAGDRAVHLGDDAGANTPYRKLKWDSLRRAHPTFAANLRRYQSEKQYYIPLPEMHE